MEVNIIKLLRREVYDMLEKYVKDNKTGLAYTYLIMSNETKSLLCDENSTLFYGIKIALKDDLDFGEVIIK